MELIKIPEVMVRNVVCSGLFPDIWISEEFLDIDFRGIPDISFFQFFTGSVNN